MNKKAFQIGFGLAAFAVFWLLMGAAAPMPVLRSKWTTNNDLASIIGNWTYSNRAANTTNFLRNDATGFGAPSLNGGDIWFLYGQGGIQAMTFGQGGGSGLGTNGGITLVQTAASNPLLRLVGASGQTGNILESQNNSGGRGFIVNSNAVAGTTNITGSFAPVSYVIFRQMIDSTVTNTLVETTMLSTGSGSKTISGGILKSNAFIEINLSGRYWSAVAGSQFKLNIGGNKIWQGITSETTSVDGSFDINYKVYVRNTNSVTGIGKLVCVGTGTLGRTTLFWTNAAQTVNFEIDQAIDVVVLPNLTTSSYNTQGAIISVTP